MIKLPMSCRCIVGKVSPPCFSRRPRPNALHGVRPASTLASRPSSAARIGERTTRPAAITPSGERSRNQHTSQDPHTGMVDGRNSNDRLTGSFGSPSAFWGTCALTSSRAERPAYAHLDRVLPSSRSRAGTSPCSSIDFTDRGISANGKQRLLFGLAACSMVIVIVIWFSDRRHERRVGKPRVLQSMPTYRRMAPALSRCQFRQQSCRGRRFRLASCGG